MALDRFIRWRKPETNEPVAPTREELLQNVAAYVGEAGQVDATNPHFIIITLPGQASEVYHPVQQGERWFEIFIGDDHISVITRMQDSFTNAVAAGFARLIARRWQAKLDEGM